MEPIVSIIVPSYNTPKALLRACLDSLFKQTYDDYEVIIVDDGSKIPVSEVLGDQRRNARVSVFRQDNRGVSAARNLGLSKAQGKYVAFVDADDCIDDGWLSYAVELAEQENADIVYGKVQQCSRDQIESEQGLTTSRAKIYKREDAKLLQIYLLHGRSVDGMNLSYLDLGPCGKLFKREKIGDIRFPEAIKISEDQVFNHAVLCSCSRYIITDRLAYYYIRNDESVSHSYHARAIDMVVSAMEHIKPYLYDDKEVLQAFYCRIIEEMFNALQFSIFFNGKNITFKQQKIEIQYAKDKPLVRDALKFVDRSYMPSKKYALKLKLFKTSPMLFICMKRIVNWKNRIFTGYQK